MNDQIIAFVLSWSSVGSQKLHPCICELMEWFYTLNSYMLLPAISRPIHVSKHSIEMNNWYFFLIIVALWNSMKLLKRMKPCIIKWNTLLKSWRSKVFESKVFYPLKSFLPPSFFGIFKTLILLRNQNTKENVCFMVGKKEGVKNFWGG